MDEVLDTTEEVITEPVEVLEVPTDATVAEITETIEPKLTSDLQEIADLNA